ncbi:MAG: CorA family divalent cation transporter [Gammaproteobacteria bacterium]
MQHCLPGGNSVLRYTHDQPPVFFDVGHVELYFFYDIDVILLAVEIFADDLSLYQVQHTLYGFGRAYPMDWESEGAGSHCLNRVEWLDAGGEVLAVSDYEKEDRYLAFVAHYRAPHIAAHWEYLLKPLALHHSGAVEQLRYRQIEYHRMPLIAYLAVDDPTMLSRADFIRLGLATEPGSGEVLPYSERYLRGFERRYCYDRYWSPQGNGMNTRFMCTGSTLVVIGSTAQPRFVDAETGTLGQFRHQYFLLFLVAHFHRAALLMLSDRLVNALNRLDIQNTDAIRYFKRTIRQILEIFLRFTHRYWFHEISDQMPAKEIFRMCADNLGTEELFNEVREEVQDMSHYLDSDSLRRQSNTMLRLTVVTIFGLIWTITTGFLGMNLIDETRASFTVKLLYFVLVALPATAMTLYAVLRSRRLSDFLDALSDERKPVRAKYDALANVFRRRSRPIR